jgi:hypothetical protein
MTRARDYVSRLALGIVVGALLAPGAALAAAHATDPAGTDNLSVVISDDPSPSSSPDPSTTAPVGGQNGAPGRPAPGGAGSSPAGSTGGAGPAGAGAAPASDEVSLSGALYVGGLTASATPSPDPGQGTVTLWFTVRNASESTIDATADFWMNSQLFGTRIDSEDDVAIAGLAPGESRVVSAQLTSAGQWTLIDAHVTLTPPDSVDGMPLSPVTRDALVVAFPWLIAASAGAVLLGLLVLHVLRLLASARVAEGAA